MIENLGEMDDALRPLRDTQGEIVILRAAEFGAQALELADEGRAVALDVPPVHVRAQEIGTPVRLEARLRPAAIGLEDVVIAVDDVDAGMGTDGLRQQRDGIAAQDVVVIAEGEVVAGCHCDAVVACDGNSSGLLASLQHDL